MRNQALWHIDTHHSELRDVDKPDAPGLISIHAIHSLISTGTERLVASGRVNSDLANKMAVPGMEGGFSLPVKYGYSLVGKTESGQLVHALHPHQRTAYVDKNSVFELEAGDCPRRMCLISNMETVINAIWDVEYFTGLTTDLPIAICGFGNIGALLAMTLKTRYGLNPDIIETAPWNLKKAEQLGFNAFLPSQQDKSYSLIFNASCAQNGLQWAIDHAEFEALIVELSWYAGQSVQLNLGGQFHYNRLRLISSQVSSIPGHKPQESYTSRKQLARSILAARQFDSLFQADIPFEHSPEFFHKLRHERPQGLLWCIDYA